MLCCVSHRHVASLLVIIAIGLHCDHDTGYRTWKEGTPRGSRQEGSCGKNPSDLSRPGGSQELNRPKSDNELTSERASERMRCHIPRARVVLHWWRRYHTLHALCAALRCAASISRFNRLLNRLHPLLLRVSTTIKRSIHSANLLYIGSKRAGLRAKRAHTPSLLLSWPETRTHREGLS